MDKKTKNIITIVVIVFIIAAVGAAIIKYLQERPGTHLVISKDSPSSVDGREVVYILNSSYGKIYFVT